VNEENAKKKLTFLSMKPVVQSTMHDRLLKLVFFGTLMVFILIVVLVRLYPENQFDRYVQELVHPLATAALLSFWTRITFFGSFEFLFPAYVIFIILNVWQRRRRFGIPVAGLAISGFLSLQILKAVVQRQRPPMALIPDVTDYSFPSGHSASSLIFCAVLSYSLWHSTTSRSLRIAGICLLSVLALLIGLSRIVLNVHYSTDVAAGFCFGMLWIVGWYKFVNKYTQIRCKD
jgi:membrane-associated phospholipid phosphatase